MSDFKVHKRYNTASKHANGGIILRVAGLYITGPFMSYTEIDLIEPGGQYMHFWYSEKQQAFILADRERNLKLNYALIDNKEVIYTVCSSTENHGCNTEVFDDIIYLGKGSYLYTK